MKMLFILEEKMEEEKCAQRRENCTPKGQITKAVVCCLAISWNIRGSWLTSGGRLNKKDGLTRYGDSHVKDKTS